MAKSSSYGIDAQMRMQSIITESKQIKSRVFRYRMIFAKKVKLTDTLSFDFKGGFDLETGSNNSSIIDVYAPQRQLVLRRAVIKWKPLDYFNFEVGGLRHYTSDFLIVSRAPFFGARANINFDFYDNYTFFFSLEESIPNNYFLAERIGTIEEEGTPHFSMQKAGVRLNGDILAVESFVNYYRYSNLSSGVASQSQFLGNSISGGGNNNSAFLYGFSGIQSFSRLNFHFNKNYGIDLQFTYAFNNDAPDRINKGIATTAGLKFFDNIVYFTNFQIDSDISPGFYASNSLGFNNTKGYDIRIKTFRGMGKSEKKRGLSYWLMYNHNEPVDNNVNQSPEDRISFYIQKNFGL